MRRSKKDLESIKDDGDYRVCFGMLVSCMSAANRDGRGQPAASTSFSPNRGATTGSAFRSSPPPSNGAFQRVPEKPTTFRSSPPLSAAFHGAPEKPTSQDTGARRTT